MRFDEFNEGLDKTHKAAIKGMHQLSGDQYYGMYKTMNDVAGHDGKKQTAPNGGSDDEVSDKPFAYPYTDEEEKMIKAVDPKAKRVTSSKSEEVKEAIKDDYETQQMWDQHHRDTEDLGIIGQGEQWGGIRRAKQRKLDKEQHKKGVKEADEWEEQGDRWNRFQKWAVNQMLNSTDKTLTGNHISQLENQYFGHPISSGVQQTGFGSVDDGRKFTKFVQSIWDNWEEHRTQAAASNAADMLGDEGQKFLKRAYDDFMGMGQHSSEDRQQHAIALSGYQVQHFNGKLFGTLGGNIRGNRASMTPEIWGILEKAEADLVQKNIIDYDERRSQEDMKFWNMLPGPVKAAIAAAMGKTPGQLEAILFNVKKEPEVQGESAQAKTDDHLMAYYAQRKAGNYDDNRTGFSRGPRDDERHDLDTPRPLIYGLKINGKIWKKDGNTVTFFTKERALAARNSILAKRPDVEVGVVQRPQD
jgi:hypothetical protein